MTSDDGTSARSTRAPAWYLTSPIQPSSIRPLRANSGSLNSARICAYGFCITCASTLSRPRCAIAMSTCFTPEAAASAMISSRIGTIRSRPSIEKRVLPGKVRCRKRSNASTLRDPVEQLAAVDRIGRRPVAPRLDRLAQPHPLVGHEDVGEVVARGRAVDGAQPFDRLVGAGRSVDHRPADDAGRQAAQHVGGQAVRLRMQRRVADRSVEADRIEPGRQVPVAAD